MWCRLLGHVWQHMAMKLGETDHVSESLSITPVYDYHRCLRCDQFMICLGGPEDAKITGHLRPPFPDASNYAVVQFLTKYTPDARQS